MTIDLLEYQNECHQIRYPFKDNATLIWINGSATGTLPNTIVLDAVVTIFGSLVQPILTSIVYNVSAWVFNFTSSFVITIYDVGGINTFYSRVGNNLLRLDIDTDALSNYFTGFEAGTLTFDSSCILCASCLKLLPPIINEIEIYNTIQNPWTNSPSENLISNITTGSINLSEGANVQLLPNQNNVTINVQAGNGEGLYNGCTAVSNSILTINNTTPTSEGGFILQTDNCFNAIPTTNGINLYNNCVAECDPQTLVNLAHYTNRVTDATTQLNTYIGEVGINYSNLINNYKTSISTPNAPYILSQSTNYANAVYNFCNVTCGIYSPSGVPVNVSLNANYSSYYSIVPNTFYITQNNEKTSLPNPSGNPILNINVGCNSVTYTGFVLQSAITQFNNGSSDNDVSLSLNSSGNVVSGTSIAMNPSSFNFNAYYTITSGSPTYITVNIDLIDPDLPTSADTTLTVNMAGYIQPVSGNITSNSITSNLPLSDFNNVPLNYNYSNNYQLILSCPSTVTGVQSISITATDGNGVTTKTLNITL